MKHPTMVASIAALSIVAIPAAVKSATAKKPVFNHEQKAPLKDSVKDTDKSEFQELVGYLSKNGHDGKIGENIAPVIGLPGARPAKGESIRSNGGKDSLNCFLIYENTDEVPGGKRPLCVYLMKVIDSPHSQDSQFFRISLDGKLEKVVTSRVKKDAEGKIIQGSGVKLDNDMTSPAVRKTYAAEMKAVKAWLKEQQVAMAKKAPTEEVKAAAEKETEKLDKEASETH